MLSTRSWKERSSTETFFFVCTHLTYFCISNSHFNVCIFNLWCLLWILYQYYNLLCICCCLLLWFMWHLYLQFNMHLPQSALLTLICSARISPLFYSFSNALCSIWSDPLDPIRSIFSDPIQSDLLTKIISDTIWSGLIQSNMIWYNLLNSLWSTHSALIWSSPLCSLQSNPIQSVHLLFPDVLSPLHYSLLLIFLGKTYY